MQSGLELEGKGKFKEACHAFEAVMKSNGPEWSRVIMHRRELQCLYDLDYWDDISCLLSSEDVGWRIEALAMKSNYE